MNLPRRRFDGHVATVSALDWREGQASRWRVANIEIGLMQYSYWREPEREVLATASCVCIWSWRQRRENLSTEVNEARSESHSTDNKCGLRNVGLRISCLKSTLKGCSWTSMSKPYLYYRLCRPLSVWQALGCLDTATSRWDRQEYKRIGNCWLLTTGEYGWLTPIYISKAWSCLLSWPSTRTTSPAWVSIYLIGIGWEYAGLGKENMHIAEAN